MSNVELTKKLAEVGALGQGTLVFLTVKKKGVKRAGQIYNDDLTQVLLWSGFHYRALVQRSMDQLDMLDDGTLRRNLAGDLMLAGFENVKMDDVTLAVQKVRESFQRVLRDAKDSDPEDESPRMEGSVFQPYVVNGQEVRGAKVYMGKGGPDPRSPVPGTVYLDGVKLGEHCLSEVEKWSPLSKGLTIAKTMLKSYLPIGLYARYALDESSLRSLYVGKEAAEKVRETPIAINPDAIRLLFKIAP